LTQANVQVNLPSKTIGQTMADQSDTAPWTIKAVPVEIRQKAVKAAHAQDQTMAQWLVDAVNLLADRQAGNQVIPPGKPAPDVRANLSGIDLPGLAAMVEATTHAAIAAGSAPPKSLSRDAAATTRAYMRAARGLPPKQTTPQNRQTLLLEEDAIR
jgi:hypothetical protein